MQRTTEAPVQTGKGWVCKRHGAFWLINKKGSNCPKCGRPAYRYLGGWEKWILK